MQWRSRSRHWAEGRDDPTVSTGAGVPAESGVKAPLAVRTFAVLSDAQLDSGTTLFAAVVRQQLAEQSGLAAVDRESFKAVVRELELARLSAAGSRGARLEAGRLLGADLLVLIEPVAGTEQSAVPVAVVETRHGFRLMLDVFEPGDDPQVPEHDGDEELVRQAHRYERAGLPQRAMAAMEKAAGPETNGFAVRERTTA